jgi:hypothetical protein
MVMMDDAILNQIKNTVEDIRQMFVAISSAEGVAKCDAILVKINMSDKG